MSSEANPPSAAEVATPLSAGRTLAMKWVIAMLLLLGTLPYLGILRNDFAYAYDDKTLILDSPYVHNFHHLREVLTTTLWSNQGAQAMTPYYRPVVKLGFLLCYVVFGPFPFGFHLVSLLLNLAAVLMLFLVGERLLGDQVAAFAAAGLFAILPVHVEAVAWIAAVTDVEVTLFALLAFWCFLQAATPEGGANWRAIAAMTVSATLAMLSKEQGVMLPVLATIYEHCYRHDRSQTNLPRKVARYGPLWLVCAAYLLVRIRLIGAIAHPMGVHPVTKWQALLSAVVLIGQYFGKFLFPLRLSAFNPFPDVRSPFEPAVLAGAVALALCAGCFYLLWKRARPASFGMVWLFVTLAPVLNVKLMGSYVLGERFAYLPSVGFCLVAGWACARVYEASMNWSTRVQAAVAAAGVVVMVLCIFRIGWRVQDWHDDITLLTRSVAEAPNDYRLHDALGAAYWVRGDLAGAEREWLTTLQLAPTTPDAAASLGVLYAQQKRFDQAIPLLAKAVRTTPNDPDAHLNLGAAYAEVGRMADAEEQFHAAVLLFPLNFNAHNMLGKVYFDSGRLEEAQQQFAQSIECEPNLAAYDYLGYVEVRRGDAAQAEKAFKAALGLNNTDSHAHFNLGLIYSAAGHTDEARDEFQAALAADPNNPEIQSALEKLHR